MIPEIVLPAIVLLSLGPFGDAKFSPTVMPALPAVTALLITEQPEAPWMLTPLSSLKSWFPVMLHVALAA